jgi:hypothetical protein
MAHDFLFQAGKWIGEGRVTFSASPEHVHFYTKWEINPLEDLQIHCQQRVEMRGVEENVFNKLVISEITSKTFSIEFENEMMGKVQGKGVIDDTTVAWEFHGKEGIEGFEVYELQENGDYMLHAEYATEDQYRTIIDGRIWKKSGG